MSGGAVRAAPENQPLDDRRVDGAPGDLALRLHKHPWYCIVSAIAGHLLVSVEVEGFRDCVTKVGLYLDKQ